MVACIVTHPFWDATSIKFEKTGLEVKQAIGARLHDLSERLQKRDGELNEVMADRQRLRSYLVRDRQRDNYYQPAQVRVEIPTEDHQKINELCTRISLIEQEIAKLSVIRDNTKDDQVFTLTYEELVTLGFGPRDGVGAS
jgi:hypothetical protein